MKLENKVKYQIKVQKHWGLLRQSCGVCLGIFGVGIGCLGFYGSFQKLPSLSLELGQVVAEPRFYESVLALSGQPEDFFTELVLNRWGFLTEYATEYTEASPQLQYISPSPKPVLPEEPQEEDLPLDLPVVTGDWEILTMTGSDNQWYQEGVYVANSGKVNLDTVDTMNAVTLQQGDSPQILIYHSHGTESYSQIEGYVYEESDPFRTLDMENNVTTVGAEMAEVFREAGYTVLHDTSLHDYPDYNSSYGNSNAMVQQYLAEYPDLALIIDLHRDALTTMEGVPYQLLSSDILEDTGESVAQVMMVIGTDGGGYEHNQWQDNFSLALSLQQGLLDYGDFVRPITLRTSRYNQQLSTAMILLEVGGHGNTLPQAVAAARIFAQSVVNTLAN